MFRLLALLLLATLLPVAAPAQGHLFSYKDWTSKDGKTIHARLNKLEGDKVTLQMKKGARRYTFERDKLSAESNAAIDKIRKGLENKIKAGSLDSVTIYQGVCLSLGRQLSDALRHKRLSFSVTEVRVESDRVSAFVGLEAGLFVQLSAGRGQEFFEKQDSLFTRPSNKTRIDPSRSINQRARLIATTHGTYTIGFGETPTLTFGIVGVSDGVIIHP